MTYEISGADEGSMFKTAYAAERYSKLKKSLTIRDEEGTGDKTADVAPS